MITLLVAALSIVSGLSEPSFSNLDDSQEVLSQEQVDYINSIQSDWVASKSWMTSLSLGEFKAMLGNTAVEPRTLSEDFYSTEGNSIAASFDARVQWPNCVTPIGNQASCSASFAFAIASSLSDRFCIGNAGYNNVYLSPQYILSCSLNATGCSGGLAYNVLPELAGSGTGLSTCVPFVGYTTSCPKVCANGTPITMYNSFNFTEYLTILQIQTEISTNGPVTAVMTAYSDFAGYTSGIYTHKTGLPAGAQNVKLLGWGTSSGTNYWIGANSWGTSWGMNGYFNIAFGQCGIEVYAASVSPTY